MKITLHILFCILTVLSSLMTPHTIADTLTTKRVYHTLELQNLKEKVAKNASQPRWLSQVKSRMRLGDKNAKSEFLLYMLSYAPSSELPDNKEFMDSLDLPDTALSLYFEGYFAFYGFGEVENPTKAIRKFKESYEMGCEDAVLKIFEVLSKLNVKEKDILEWRAKAKKINNPIIKLDCEACEWFLKLREVRFPTGGEESMTKLTVLAGKGSLYAKSFLSSFWVFQIGHPQLAQEFAREAVKGGVFHSRETLAQILRRKGYEEMAMLYFYEEAKLMHQGSLYACFSYLSQNQEHAEAFKAFMLFGLVKGFRLDATAHLLTKEEKDKEEAEIKKLMKEADQMRKHIPPSEMNQIYGEIAVMARGCYYESKSMENLKRKKSRSVRKDTE